MSKTKAGSAGCPVTHGVAAAATVAGKLAKVANADQDASGPVARQPDVLSTSLLIFDFWAGETKSFAAEGHVNFNPAISQL